MVPKTSMNQRIGYARVSTEDQNLDMQLDALEVAGCSVIYEGTASGEGAARPELEQCRKALRPGDALIVWRLDRLGRSLPDLVQIVSELEQKDIGFESVTERIETGSAAGKLVFHVFAALADFERNLIRERTNAGLAAARARGRVGGRKPKLDAKDMKEIQALWRDKSIPVADIARRYGVSAPRFTSIWMGLPRCGPDEKRRREYRRQPSVDVDRKPSNSTAAERLL